MARERLVAVEWIRLEHVMTASSSPAPFGLNKSLGTNVLAAVCVLVGLLLPEPVRRPVLYVGLFALSGAMTNWLAIHMLFEKVPGLYGSGVIPARFEEFKHEIHRLVMEQFFSEQNVERFFSREQDGGGLATIDLEPMIDQADVTPAFDALVGVVESSSFGGLLAMAGGSAALEPLKEPFAAKMKAAIKELTRTPAFKEMAQAQLKQGVARDAMVEKVEGMVQQRLAELTPQMVKDIMQQMIHKHLGWLVVWGGVFGGLIGLVTTFIPCF